MSSYYNSPSNVTKNTKTSSNKVIKSGWLCGGNIYIEYIRSERKLFDAILINNDGTTTTTNKSNRIKELYPFIIELKCKDTDAINRICLDSDNFEIQKYFVYND